MNNTLFTRIAPAFPRFAPLLAACALAMAIAFVPGTAHAGADDEGDLDAPNAAAGAPAASTAQDDSSSDDVVSIAADGMSASIDGSPFALENFSRSQVGSNGDVDGVYEGYRYFVSDEPGSLGVIATDGLTVVYVPAEVAEAVGFDAGSSESRGYLKRLLVALDAQNSKGGATLSVEGEWVFSGQPEIEQDGVAYRFDQELKPGEYYACVVGADGSDVTDASNPSYVRLTHADFATLSPADQVSVVGAPEGFAALASFLQNIDYSPLWVTLKTTLTAIVFIFILGLLAAYFSLRIPARAQDIADSIFTIPMVLPPTVCGFLLLLAFGKNTALGQWFIDIGFPLIFSWQATVIAAVVVAFPLMYRSARGAFENLDPNMLDAARTLGWSNAKIFFKLMLPLSWSSIAAGTVLSFARALGEFGATLFLAGNYLGVTRTIPIAIYFEWMNGNTDVAIFWTVIIMIFSFIVILFINLWSRRTTKYRRGADA
ncbi:molybdate ABC transporter permease subunit [Eggerthella guodeyinii]|uniref:Molybdate ABC transporter permease subunit n=1 Tax=Eggerthella guodeyinii TaxID=2690837 RepID=A0A6N7RRM3_9ACTN|nr:molybdate ABC transporter permease subunit [Eggerthella guodeyinii]MRX83551.1 molybdate ABC transporter permease subunit [Eggerthella guodeyinii]